MERELTRRCEREKLLLGREKLSYLTAWPAMQVAHTKREANQVAHTLARNAFKVNSELVWIEEIP